VNRLTRTLILASLAATGSLGRVNAQTVVQAPTPTVLRTAVGAFDVNTAPDGAPKNGIARFLLTKRYHGALDGVGEGWMLGVRNGGGSAGYVAMERVTGALDGRRGGFVLQHSGTMDHGKLSLSVEIVPGSGAGALTGITGAMAIDTGHGSHSYTLTYSLVQLPKPGRP